MEDLVRWLNTQLDEDERIARAATPGPWEQGGIGDYGWTVSFSRRNAGVETEDGEQGHADAEFIAEHDPARVLREIDSKRRVLGAIEHLLVQVDDPFADVDGVLRLLAVPYADRPGYREEWRP
ncbi:hypothetical protein IHE56_00940 [Streptomyces sp. ID01-12c]|uniref:Uncharacterized protein n=1 Tax=Streptomyces caniscabiei TaxID=2746961 RepID=A0A927QEL1_9ACTN|nr:DUF6221 family protein [Streptomyces caniscabiei]MBD9700678.1 hypothetical protein [Streptomyces caniscabiei]MBD9723476.1 hypothetical protein [Streptomyces caniscabiei]MDX3516026.1 DUF6221 family protein [Streptomyces caniscabiei]MDX3725168.1 DUF6221 family protein [Streptomyces caniscabiei]WEO27046.1 DUF6221 family protein [Streptomyces caniscabiei]